MSTTTVPVTTPAPSRRAAALLCSTIIAFAAYLVVAVATVATKAETTSAELTPADLSDLGASWVVLHLLWMAPSVLAILGLAAIAGRVRPAGSAIFRGLVVVTLLLAAAYEGVQVLALGVATPAWGDSGWYAVGVALSLAVGWLGTIPATLLVTGALARQGVVRRTVRTIAVLTWLYLLWEVATYAVVAFGPVRLADVAGPPPFLLGIVWTVLGASWWVATARTDDGSRRVSR